jgi:hypothetical protein
MKRESQTAKLVALITAYLTAFASMERLIAAESDCSSAQNAEQKVRWKLIRALVLAFGKPPLLVRIGQWYVGVGLEPISDPVICERLLIIDADKVDHGDEIPMPPDTVQRQRFSRK